jgi:hypothetical protein
VSVSAYSTLRNCTAINILRVTIRGPRQVRVAVACFATTGSTESSSRLVQGRPDQPVWTSEQRWCNGADPGTQPRSIGGRVWEGSAVACLASRSAIAFSKRSRLLTRAVTVASSSSVARRSGTCAVHPAGCSSIVAPRQRVLLAQPLRCQVRAPPRVRRWSVYPRPPDRRPAKPTASVVNSHRATPAPVDASASRLHAASARR